MHPVVRRQLPLIIESCKRHHVRRLALFGSALDDTFDPVRSDLDLLIDFEPLEPGDHARHYLDLIVELEEALGRRVDVVERHMLKNRYVRASVDKHHLVLYYAA